MSFFVKILMQSRSIFKIWLSELFGVNSVMIIGFGFRLKSCRLYPMYRRMFGWFGCEIMLFVSFSRTFFVNISKTAWTELFKFFKLLKIIWSIDQLILKSSSIIKSFSGMNFSFLRNQFVLFEMFCFLIWWNHWKTNYSMLIDQRI